MTWLGGCGPGSLVCCSQDGSMSVGAADSEAWAVGLGSLFHDSSLTVSRRLHRDLPQGPPHQPHRQLVDGKLSHWKGPIQAKIILLLEYASSEYGFVEQLTKVTAHIVALPIVEFIVQ